MAGILDWVGSFTVKSEDEKKSIIIFYIHFQIKQHRLQNFLGQILKNLFRRFYASQNHALSNMEILFGRKVGVME